MDCNNAIQELKSYQVEVRFEKENISTFDPTAEFLFNITAIVAQEVSHSISKSIRWRIQKDFAKGKHRLGNNMILGYDVVDKQLVPNKNAWIIKYIFDAYLYLNAVTERNFYVDTDDANKGHMINGDIEKIALYKARFGVIESLDVSLIEAKLETVSRLTEYMKTSRK